MPGTRELDREVVAAFTGERSAPGPEALRSRLRNDPGARESYDRLVTAERALARAVAGEEALDEGGASARERRRGAAEVLEQLPAPKKRRRGLWLFLPAAATALIALLFVIPASTVREKGSLSSGLRTRVNAELRCLGPGGAAPADPLEARNCRTGGQIEIALTGAAPDAEVRAAMTDATGRVVFAKPTRFGDARRLDIPADLATGALVVHVVVSNAPISDDDLLRAAAGEALPGGARVSWQRLLLARGDGR